ncbi:carbohydrate binding domain-containing protein [[Clostridium] fimetarium]|uniref:Beta-glucanase, GH16 family n=1 Tax=[Clostridium] fimetarium TaxID=99656 RepID=A0A1I0M5V4_9FIRM|nr:carbohydrate binding domain-containing protein [[Clostridium] fimetarium]SEV83324.1 Beta-glucanase, GH16 family [[Clostridium] fimetarium]
MLKRSKIVAGVAVVFLSMATMMMMPVFAAEDTNRAPELSVQTDKSEYSDSDNIAGIVKVNNLSTNPLTNIEIKVQVPEGYVTEDGKGSSGEWIYTIAQIAKGDTSETNVVFTPKKADQGAVQNANNNPGTGDFSHAQLWVCILLISAGFIVFVVKKKKGKKLITVLLVITMIGAMVPAICMSSAYAAETGTESKTNTATNTITATKDITVAGKNITLLVKMTFENQGQVADKLSYEGYNLKWQDEFNETTLNRDDWNVETHDAGWVNQEKQQYVDSAENIYLKDGKLVLQPIKTVDQNGVTSYTSGRITTQNKENFKYGIFETRVKVPKGQGYLPAFWLMAADENKYGQWPRCGEIDAMEVMGQDTSKAYATLHFGNPHNQSQGTSTLSNDTFSDTYHDFAVEWLPGKINWYMDGVLFHSADNWYSTTEGQGEITYPAPFDQQFYMILNLAVGGSWVGNPDETTDFNNQAYSIDYVKVYQKDSYDENVTKPESSVTQRDPAADGNYIINGDFATAENLTDDKDWKFITALGGDAQAVINNNKIDINNITNGGTADYSVQLVQPNIPLKKGGNYQVTFDAWADEARTMKVGVTGPDNGYVRYMADTKLDLTTQKSKYTFDFSMKQADDANGRMEFNMGNAGSTANIHITNVTLKKISQSDGSNEAKTVLADGNYVYNANFQEGANHLGFWNIKLENGKAYVTPLEDGRRLKIEAPEGTTASKPVVISQNGLALTAGINYALSFKAEGESGKSIQAAVAGKTFDATLDGKNNFYSYSFTMPATSGVNDIAFTISKPGVYYLDEIRIAEDTLIKNGSFNAGLAGYEAFVDTSAKATCVVDSITEKNVAAALTIDNTGDAAWKIQLKQNNVELVKDQWYKLTLDAKSSIDRKLMFAIQRDGSGDNNWDPYSGEQIVDLKSGYQKFTIEFQMTKATDLKSILSISMGAVDGKQITTQHQICIDNINLEKIATPGRNLLKNSNFVNGSIDNWESAITAPGQATAIFTDNKATYAITNVGSADWNVQLKQSGITLEQGHKYKVTFKAKSTEARTIKMAMLTTKYDWYGGADIALTKDVTKDVVAEFTVDKATDMNMTMVVSMGVIDGVATPASTITLSDFSLVEVQ